jgi:hypothetical protein
MADKLQDHERAIVSKFSAEQYRATGQPGMVIAIRGSDDRTTLFYQTVAGLASFIRLIDTTDLEADACVLVLDESTGPLAIEVVPRDTRH